MRTCPTEGADVNPSPAQPASGHDAAFPGENWFFYWKSAPSLWESKLRAYTGPRPIFVPLSWAHHMPSSASTPEFGPERPDADLYKLLQIARSLSKEIVFLLPVGPLPFLTNGGIPADLARIPSMGRHHLTHAISDADSTIIRLYSFYDPRVYQSYKRFVWALGQLISSIPEQVPVFGLQAGYMNDEGDFVSYIEDRSSAYEDGFLRFMKQKMGRGELPTVSDNAADDERRNRHEFRTLIDELYTQSARECLGVNWNGILQFTFLGGAPNDLFMRASDEWDHHLHYFPSIFQSVTHHAIPCSVLLRPEFKQGVLERALLHLSDSAYVKGRVDTQIYEEDLVTLFAPLFLFQLHVNSVDSGANEGLRYQRLGILPCIQRIHHWSYRLTQELPSLEDEAITKRLYFFYGRNMDKTEFQAMLRVFMSGGRVYFDRSSLHPLLQKKLDIFFYENSINQEHVNYQTPLIRATLGDGVLLLFDGDALASAVPSLEHFWSELIAPHTPMHLTVQTDDHLFFLWHTRAPKGNELKFEEVRRVSFYNPTSYKKRAQIHADRHFALLKIVDEQHAHVHSSQAGVEVDLLPGGSVALDFGHFDS